jgi:hypothetical protein
MIQEYRPLTTHTLTAGTATGTTRTSAFDDQVQAVLVTATEDVFVEFGGTPTATVAASVFITADYPQIFRVNGSDKAAAITGSGTSSVYITELSR